MKISTPEIVRATIAARMLGTEVAPARVGDVALQPHQCEGAARALSLIRAHGGALVADEVGMGKTYTALGVASAFTGVLVVAPAKLREMWTGVATASGRRLRFVSLEALGRHAVQRDMDLIVIDEAHHLRNADTMRYRAACDLCRSENVLLLTATPVQNRLDDLRNLLALFLGARAYSADESELARFIVRRDATTLRVPEALRLPEVSAVEWLRIQAPDGCIERVLALPRAVPPRDGDDGGILLTLTLARQWASSKAAFANALKRRVARGLAMLDALGAGRLPTRADLTAWSYSDGSQQLAFPELVAADRTFDDTAAIARQVRQHVDGVRELIGWLGAQVDADTERTAVVLDVLRRHPGERIVAFSEFAETVSAYYTALVPHARVAMLTHAGGQMVGGRISRSELIARFAPGGSNAAPSHERVDLLLSTDVLSEGVSLHDASVLVHLDLTWNPARLVQRVGRLRRLGASRREIAVYAFAPPPGAERLVELERRLRAKARLAARTIGIAGEILPGMARVRSADAAAAREERIAAILRSWRGSVTQDAIAAGVRSSRTGVLACLQTSSGAQLVSVHGSRISQSRAAIEELLGLADGPRVDVEPDEVEATRATLQRWLDRRAVTDIVDLSTLHLGRERRSLLRRVATIAGRTPRHCLPEVASRLDVARATAGATLPAGAERVLDQLATAPLDDEAWLTAIGEFAALHTRPRGPVPVIAALLLLRPR